MGLRTSRLRIIVLPGDALRIPGARAAQQRVSGGKRASTLLLGGARRRTSRAHSARSRAYVIVSSGLGDDQAAD